MTNSDADQRAGCVGLLISITIVCALTSPIIYYFMHW